MDVRKFADGKLPHERRAMPSRNRFEKKLCGTGSIPPESAFPATRPRWCYDCEFKKKEVALAWEEPEILMQDWSYINRCSRCGAGNPRDSELCIRCGLPMRQMRPEDERGDESLEADAVAVRGNLDSASKCAMMFEAEIRVTRFPIYLCTSVLFAALSILLIAGVVAWSGSQMLGFADLRDKIDTPVYPVREAARDVSGLGMLFFAALWFLAPATASLIAIAGSGAVLDFQQPRWRIGFRLFTLALVLAALWPLMPWIVRYSNVDGEIIQSRVDVFRFIHIGANLLVGLMLAFASRDESQPDTTMSGNAGSTGT